MLILLPLDPGDQAFPYALGALERLAQPDDQVHVLHVAEPPFEWVSDRTGPAPADDGPLRRSLETTVQERGFSNVRVTVTHDTRRHVGDTIVELAGSIEADLIVMPTHGRSGLPRLVLGSVTERVIRHAPCDVYVVRVPREA